jgi:uncharacterized Fe-S cluster-containing radical SAM superfamily protein
MRNSSKSGTDFTVSCPHSTGGNTPVQEIRARGNLPLVLQEDMVIELKRSDLLESWRATCALGRKQVDELVQKAASRITSALDEDDFIDAPGLASDTAAFFLLALRHKGMKLLPACAITFHDDHIEVRTENKLIN